MDNNDTSVAISKEIQRFESVHPSIYALYDLIELVPDKLLQQQIRDHVIVIESSFVNNQEWTLPRNVTEYKLGLLGAEMCGKAALVYRFLIGKYTEEDKLDGGRYKKEVKINGQNYLLLIRDEAGPPDNQFAEWFDALLLVFSLENLKSFQLICNYLHMVSQMKKLIDLPVFLVGTQDYITANNPRVIEEAQINKLMHEFHFSGYYETCATYGLGIDKVFQEACEKIYERNQINLKRAMVSTLHAGLSHSSSMINSIQISNNNVASNHGDIQQQGGIVNGLPKLKRYHNAVDLQSPTITPVPRPKHFNLNDHSSSRVEPLVNFISDSQNRQDMADSSNNVNSCSNNNVHQKRSNTNMNSYESKGSIINSIPISPMIRSQIDRLALQNHPYNYSSTSQISNPKFFNTAPPLNSYQSSKNFNPNKMEHSQTSANIRKQQQELSTNMNINNNIPGKFISSAALTNYATNLNLNSDALNNATPPSKTNALNSPFQKQLTSTSNFHHNSHNNSNNTTNNHNISNTNNYNNTPNNIVKSHHNINIKKTKGCFIPTYFNLNPNPNNPISTNNNNLLINNAMQTTNPSTTLENVGIGRVIPIKQGWLYKKSTKTLNKEWKKKYVTLNSNGILIYHPNIQDYMSNDNGKEIPLLHTTVKVPGQHQQIQVVNTNTTGSQNINSTPTSHTNTNASSNIIETANNLNLDLNKVSLGQNSSVSQSFIKRLNTNIQQHLSSSSHHHNDLGASTPTNSMPSDLNSSLLSYNGADANTSITTPLVKKKHKRNKSGENGEFNEFVIISSDNKQWHFDASSPTERQEWVKAIEAQILSGLSDLTSRNFAGNNPSSQNATHIPNSETFTYNNTNSNQLSSDFSLLSLQSGQHVFDKSGRRLQTTPTRFDRPDGFSANNTNLSPEIVAEKLNYIKTRVPGNEFCVDCHLANPEWASLNFGALMCIECSGIHRNLGVHISKIRSLQLDDWPPEYLTLMQSIGNAICNSVYEQDYKGRTKPNSSSNREEKERWIRAKYESKEFLAPLPFSQNHLAENLQKAVILQDIPSVMLILAHLSLVPLSLDNKHHSKQNSNKGDNTRQSNSYSVVNAKCQHPLFEQQQVYAGKTPLHIATLLGNVTIVQLLLWNEADPNLTDRDGLTPYDIALKMRFNECITVLYKRTQKH